MERFSQTSKNNSAEALDAMLAEYQEKVETAKQHYQEAQAVAVAMREAGDEAGMRASEELLHMACVEYVQSAANYPGDWTLVQYERFLHPTTKARFIKLRERYLSEMKTGVPGMFDKPKKFTSHYERQVDGYDQNLQSVFAATGVGAARADYGKSPQTLGAGNIGEGGVVFDDAVTSDGESLTVRQKNIIEAHEKYHGMVDYESSERAELVTMFDPVVAEYLFDEHYDADGNNVAANYNYLTNPDEITARLAQLKNYFGMKGDEGFTAEHLSYAREHYVHDTGLDNTMTEFLAMITGRTKDQFLRIINTYPV